MKSLKGFMAHLLLGSFTTLFISLFLFGIYLFEEPKFKLVSGIGVLLACETMVIIAKRIQRVWKQMKPLGYYFLPATAFFWLLDQRRHRLETETKIAQLRELIASWPDVSLGITTGIIDLNQQERVLTILLNEMGSMKDSRLATVTERIRQYLPEILNSVKKCNNYPLFGQVMMRLSSFKPGRYRQTYKSFLGLLSDTFNPWQPESFDRHFQKYMKGPLQNAIDHADKGYNGHIQNIVARIMADEEDKHEIPNSVTTMLLQLDWNEKREICRIIFDESLKRAFRFPKNFGIDFLNTLSQLEHRIFWLDVQSLRKVLEDSLTQEGIGLINMNLGVYGRICSKVLAPIENPECNGIRNARVFRRLKGDNGKVWIECTSPDGHVCRCEGESLSFRGVYSKACQKNAGEKLSMNIVSVQDAQRRFTVKAKVAPLHAYEAGSQGPGRGAFFEEADPTAVRDLYEYVSTKE
ncbi:MAG: hypothetical protein JXM79_02660 [Sedimentisphaerales bacterium]|nr:hypothetical protein [Sedimentisphaerales bacterium]